jgi:hypothetical protein
VERDFGDDATRSKASDVTAPNESGVGMTSLRLDDEGDAVSDLPPMEVRMILRSSFS